MTASRPISRRVVKKSGEAVQPMMMWVIRLIGVQVRGDGAKLFTKPRAEPLAARLVGRPASGR
jgi:hypothetical protein